MWMSTLLFRSRVEGTEEVHVTSQRFNAKKPKAPNAAASGKVVIQAKRIPTIMFQWACRVTVPIPNNAPHETWVVDTGSPSLEARMTMVEVTRLAVNPWPEFIAVTRWDMVSATRLAFSKPPTAITRATPTSPASGLKVRPKSNIAPILGCRLDPVQN